MQPRFSKQSAIILSLSCLCVTGCGLGSSSALTGRWFNKVVSIRFRENGTVLYNSRSTGLVEGRYQYDPKEPLPTGTQPVKNLTVWLPQPGRIVVLDFELRLLGNERIQLKPIPQPTASSSSLDVNSPMGAVLKRAPNDEQHSDGLDESPPLVSASPND